MLATGPVEVQLARVRGTGGYRRPARDRSGRYVEADARDTLWPYE